MKKMIFKTILFCIIGYVLLFIIDTYISHKVNIGSDYDGLNYLYSDSSTASMLVFGSSRAQSHFDPRIIEDSLKIQFFNMGITGSKIDIHSMVIEEYLKHCKKRPRYITLVVDIHDLNFSSKSIVRHYRFFPYLLFNLNLFKTLKEYNGFKFHYFYIPAIRYSRYLGNMNQLQSSYKGYYSYKYHYNQNLVPPKYNFDSISSIYYLKKIIKRCNQENIKLNLVFSPEYKDGKKIFNRNKILEFYKKNKYS